MNIKKLSLAALSVFTVVGVAFAADWTGSFNLSAIPNFNARAIAPATPTGVLVGTAGNHTIAAVQIGSKASQGAWLKIYDTATAPTCGSGTPIISLPIPAASTAANLGGSNPLFGLTGTSVTNGIGVCVTGDLPNADTTAITANTIVWNMDYR